MKKHDDFDLDLKLDSANGSDAGTNATGGVICWSITVSLQVCGPASKAIDCTSKNHDCSNTRSACTPCTSGYAYQKEEPNAGINC
ncbi:MAG: hypothetical protein Q4G11_02580 [Gallicola sp.]|nr:hypothetical protein [Gallicola sp.]